MNITYFPEKENVDLAILDDDPLLMLISYDGKDVIVSNIDDAYEHVILLKSVGLPESDLEKYFRIIVNKDGADWTFVCPAGYKNIKDKNKRISVFFNDGVGVMDNVLKQFGYNCEINIPKRYRRHFDLLSENE